jgi:FdhE protein
MIASPWDRRIERASELIPTFPSAAEMLRFYREIARFQKSIYEEQPPQVSDALRRLPALLALVKQIGPADLARKAEESGFLERWLLQPFYEYRASQRPVEPGGEKAACPFCGERPQVGVLRGEGDGAKRSLICSLCSTEWDFRRLLCPSCGEEAPEKLPVYLAEEIPYIRVEACDTCHTYIKAVDLSKNGLAVPLVDELATVSLSLWAQEHEYTKLQVNLLGM